jgi:hypothetical protein
MSNLIDIDIRTPGEGDEPPKRRTKDPDSGKRFRDALALHHAVLSREEILARRFMAVSLLDGSSDGHAYESRDEAVQKQRSHVDGNRVLYFQIPLELLTVRACESLLWYGRKAYDAGYRPVGVHERGPLHIPTRWEELHRP